nr:MAG TPA: hypothetical protein [Caudoviricetes sp.]
MLAVDFIVLVNSSCRLLVHTPYFRFGSCDVLNLLVS